MSFVHPAFLWALTALAIPVLIHLFQLRRFKRIDFPNVRFLAEVTQQTRARRKVQHWLVLLARCLALASLVLAFAQPYLPHARNAVKVGERAVSIFIDDSFSMDGRNPEGRLLDQARKGAQDAVLAYSATDRFQVLTGRFSGKEQTLLGRDEALEASGQVEAGPFTRAMSTVMARQREALARSEAPVKQALLLTDLQRSVLDVTNWTDDENVPVLIAPIPSSTTENLAIDSVWFGSPVRRQGQHEALYVRIKNYGTAELVNVPLRLDIDGRQRALATFSIGPEAVIDTVLRFTTRAGGDHWGRVALDDRPVVFDNDLFIAYHVIERLNVLLISGGDEESDRSIADVFAGDSLHVFTSRPLRSLDLAMIDQQDLIILNALPETPSGLVGSLDAFVEGGGSVAFFPPVGGDPEAAGPLFTRFGGASPARGDTALAKVDRIDLEKPFYRDIFETMQRNVDLPVVRERWRIRPAVGSDVLLRLQDGSPYLYRTGKGRGSLYVCATPLASSAGNFTRHAFFLTSLLRMAELSRPMGALYNTIGAEVMIPLEGLELEGEQAPHLNGPNGMDLVPEIRRKPGALALVLHDQDLPPGPYALVNGSDTVRMLALDLPRKESDLSSFTAQELREELAIRGLNTITVLDERPEDLSLRLNELDRGHELWKWFVLLALLFLIIEVILLSTKR